MNIKIIISYQNYIESSKFITLYFLLLKLKVLFESATIIMELRFAYQRLTVGNIFSTQFIVLRSFVFSSGANTVPFICSRIRSTCDEYKRWNLTLSNLVYILVLTGYVYRNALNLNGKYSVLDNPPPRHLEWNGTEHGFHTFWIVYLIWLICFASNSYSLHTFLTEYRHS